MDMNVTKICPGCQRPLVADAPDGLCPQRLMKAGLGTHVDVGPDSQGESERTPFMAPFLEEVARLFRWGAAERSRGAALSADPAARDHAFGALFLHNCLLRAENDAAGRSMEGSLLKKYEIAQKKNSFAVFN